MADTLFQKEGIALRALDELRAELRHVRAVPQEAPQELLGHPLLQRVDGDLGVVAFLAPGLLVLRPVRDEEQDARGGQARHESVEDGLRLLIDPVQVLDHEAEWSAVTLADEQVPDGVERAARPGATGRDRAAPPSPCRG